jgi:hypothetical protein
MDTLHKGKMLIIIIIIINTKALITTERAGHVVVMQISCVGYAVTSLIVG